MHFRCVQPGAYERLSRVRGKSVQCPVSAMRDAQLRDGNSTVYSAASMARFLDSADGARFRDMVGFSGPVDLNSTQAPKLKFIQIEMIGSIFTFQPHSIISNYKEQWDRFFSQVVDGTSKHGSAFHLGGHSWVWMVTQETLVSGMYKGMAICFPLSFLVLLFATRNVYLASFSIVSILFIVACVLGSTKIIGWSLGTAESIAAVMVIGFSVDYTVHLAHMYGESGTRLSTRGFRVKEALRRMGEPVIAGAVTTFASGAMMFLCQITFFTKMAVLISLTICFSVIFAFGFLLSLCSLIGPVDSQGSICCTDSPEMQSERRERVAATADTPTQKQWSWPKVLMPTKNNQDQLGAKLSSPTLMSEVSLAQQLSASEHVLCIAHACIYDLIIKL